MHALAWACQLSKGKSVNLYTHSKYAFRVVHGFDILWKQTEVFTSSRTPIKNGPQVKELPSAILLPNQIAIIKMEAYTGKIEPGYQGDAVADLHAKSANTKTVPICNLNELHKIDSNQIIHDNLYKRQNLTPKLEQQCWDQQGCKFNIK